MRVSGTPRRLAFLAALLLLLPLAGLAGMLAWPPAHHGPALARSAPIEANRQTLPVGVQVLGPLPASHAMRLVIALAPHDPSRLARFLRMRTQPGSSLFGATLSPTQFAALFGPSAGAQAGLIAYLRAKGLRVVRTYPDRMLLDVDGTAAQVEAAFGISLMRFRDLQRGRSLSHDSPISPRRGNRKKRSASYGANGVIHFANAAVPHLPSPLAGLVSAVVGLRDDGPAIRRPVPGVVRPPFWRSRRHRSATNTAATVAPPAGLLTPQQLRTAYAIDSVYAQSFSSGGSSTTVPITGTGQSVAMFELSPYDPTDVAAYDAAFNLASPPPTTIQVDGGPTTAFGSLGQLEASLDIELAQAVAPGAQILVYSGPGDPNSSNSQGLDDTYARIINDNTAQVLSTSWGECEPDVLLDTPSPDLDLLHNLFAQASAEGMSVVAATADSGANDCSDGQPNPSIDYPSSDPSVIAVGGTVLKVDSTGQVLSETGWSGSNGGVSRFYARSAWQVSPGLPVSTMRLTPDVAANAGTGDAIYAAGGWQGAGGTSAAVPIWAALLALANQTHLAAAVAAGTPTPATGTPVRGLGDIHRALYRLGAGADVCPTPGLRDITAGDSNGIGTPGPGWDFVTGLGVPDAAGLVPALGDPALAGCGTVTPTATQTATQTASDTATTTQTPTSSPTASATLTPTNSPTASATAGTSPMPSSTRSASATPTSTSSATATGTTTSTSTPTPSATATVTGTFSVTPSPTVTSTPNGATVQGSSAAALTFPTLSAPAPPPTQSSTPLPRIHVQPRGDPSPKATSTVTPTCRGSAGAAQSGANCTAASTWPAGTAVPTKQTQHIVKVPAHAPIIKARKSTVRHKATVHAARRRLIIPPLLAKVAISRQHGVIWVRVTAHYAPNVQLNLTVIEKRQKRRHFRIRTNNQGAASYRYTEPRLSTQRTVMLKIWGVYAHHRRQVIVRYKI